MPNVTDETRIARFIVKVKDLAHRSQQEPILVAIAYIYVILYDILEALGGTFGQGKGTILSIRDREDKP